MWLPEHLDAPINIWHNQVLVIMKRVGNTMRKQRKSEEDKKTRKLLDILWDRERNLQVKLLETKLLPDEQPLFKLLSDQRTWDEIFRLARNDNSPNKTTVKKQTEAGKNGLQALEDLTTSALYSKTVPIIRAYNEFKCHVDKKVASYHEQHLGRALAVIIGILLCWTVIVPYFCFMAIGFSHDYEHVYPHKKLKLLKKLRTSPLYKGAKKTQKQLERLHRKVHSCQDEDITEDNILLLPKPPQPAA
jgi:hypothetical protein